MTEPTKSILLVAIIVCVALLPVPVTCHKDFQTKIPNGDQVPHPCKTGRTWQGVGHELVMGSGARNKFGEDFKAHGQNWTVELCQMDSDGDGLTNGEELGDPECRWRPGRVPEITDVKRLSHPGIYTCTSWDSPDCQQQAGDVEWVSRECEDKAFDCPAMEEPDVITEDIHLPPSPIPAKTTTYMCMDYVVKSSGTYHMVATTPIIKEPRVVHHMLLFGCEDEDDNDVNPRFDPGKTYECGMLPACRGSILSMWSYGMEGDCSANEVGFRIGATGYKRLSLQVHWNNRYHNPDMTDASGLKLYLTTKLRQHDAGVWVIGSVHLNIPPRMTKYVAQSTCAPKCTENYMSGPIFVTGLLNHMHYLGKSMKVEIIRNGRKHMVVGDVEYNYDNPNFHEFDRPFEVRPGDELRTTCTYSSAHKNETTTWGESSDDEMCFAFVTYYPDQHVRESLCYSWDMVPYCYQELDIPFEGCDIDEFLEGAEGWLEYELEKLEHKCAVNACLANTCLPVLYDLRSQPCLRGPVYNFLKYNIGEGFKRFHQLYTSCDNFVHKATPEPRSGADAFVTWQNRNYSSVIYVVVVALVVFLSGL